MPPCPPLACSCIPERAPPASNGNRPRPRSREAFVPVPAASWLSATSTGSKSGRRTGNGRQPSLSSSLCSVRLCGSGNTKPLHSLPLPRPLPTRTIPEVLFESSCLFTGFWRLVLPWKPPLVCHAAGLDLQKYVVLMKKQPDGFGNVFFVWRSPVNGFVRQLRWFCFYAAGIMQAGEGGWIVLTCRL